MPTNFERTCAVLDALDAKASAAAGGPVDAAVKASLSALSAAYPTLMSPSRSVVDYRSAPTHIAYAFRCLAAHGDLLFRTLESGSLAVCKALKNDPLKIVCVGGGPGSDALGFIKFAERYGLSKRKLKFVFLDREPAWLAVREALFPTFVGINAKQKFVQTDIAGGPPWANDWSFSDADLYTLSFALSEVWAFNGSGSVSDFLNRLVSSAKKVLCSLMSTTEEEASCRMLTRHFPTGPI